MTDAAHLRATGRTIGYAPSTASFVRAQHARGVSLETLQRQLKIRPEHMLDMLVGHDEIPLPKAEIATTPAEWVPRYVPPAPEKRGGSVNVMKARAAKMREEAKSLAAAVLPEVSSATGLSQERIVSKNKTGADIAARSMFFGLASALRPDLALSAIGEAINRPTSSAHDGVFICRRLCRSDAEFERRYLRALARLAQ